MPRIISLGFLLVVLMGCDVASWCVTPSPQFGLMGCDDVTMPPPPTTSLHFPVPDILNIELYFWSSSILSIYQLMIFLTISYSTFNHSISFREPQNKFETILFKYYDPVAGFVFPTRLICTFTVAIICQYQVGVVALSKTHKFKNICHITARGALDYYYGCTHSIFFNLTLSIIYKHCINS